MSQPDNLIVVGYVLIEGSARTAWMHPSLPATIYTPTNCVSTLHPSDAALTWVQTSENKTTYLKNLYFDPVHETEFQADADRLFDESLWGADGVFVEHETAVAFWHKWFQGRSDIQLFELALPHDLLPKFLDSTSPHPHIGTALPSGKHLAAQKAASSLANTLVLGFEVWGVQIWGDMHTSVCYDVRDDFIRDLNVTFNDWGLLPTLDLARKAADLNNDAEGGSVGDSDWFPVRLAQVPMGDN